MSNFVYFYFSEVQYCGTNTGSHAGVGRALAALASLAHFGSLFITLKNELKSVVTTAATKSTTKRSFQMLKTHPKI